MCLTLKDYLVTKLGTSYRLISRGCNSVGADVFPGATRSTSTVAASTTCTAFGGDNCKNLFGVTANVRVIDSRTNSCKVYG